jgi:alkaline phosphatase D
MLSSLAIPLVALLGNLARASPEIYERNLVYRSPYVSHPALGIDTQAVTKRHVEASLLVRREMQKRQEQTEKPAGEDDEYPTPTYGLGVTDWSNAGYIYAGDLNFTHGIASGMALSCPGLAVQLTS